MDWRNQIVSRLNQDTNQEWGEKLNRFIDEVAYTWFNRIIAIRFMEVNDYLPSRTRVLSSEEGWVEPDMVTHALEIEDDLGGYSDEERAQVTEALTSHNPTQLDKVFRMLFIKQTDELSNLLPGLFEKTSDYMKLLFVPNYNNGVIKELVDEISEENFDVSKSGQVSILGWLYQYYISDEKNRDMSQPKSVKFNSKQIYEVTQIFTPDWIVKYMVQDSLGKYWIHHLQNTVNDSEKELAEKFGWKYYIPDGKQNAEISNRIRVLNKQEDINSIEAIKVIDPACGSGHILVYMFDLLMDIYLSEGYSQREASRLIINNNLYGLEVDKRAYQLSYFAVMMKWRQFDRRAFSRNDRLHIHCFVNIDNVLTSIDVLKPILSNDDYDSVLRLIEAIRNANVLGSLLILPDKEETNLDKYKDDVRIQNSFEAQYVFGRLNDAVKACNALITKYNCVVANPPYMSSARMNDTLTKYASKYYPDSKRDLFAMFMERWTTQNVKGGYSALVTMQSWMFLASYEKFRHKILNSLTISSLMHMENEVMGIAFGTAATIFKNDYMPSFKGFYHLVKTSDAVNKVPKTVPIKDNRYALIDKNSFDKIPGSPIAYWAPQALINDFEKGKPLGQLVDAKQGLATADNKRFLRYWYEVDFNNIFFDAHNTAEAKQSGKKWFPYNKGGSYRKWYGNYDYVVNWQNDGYEIKHFTDSRGKVRSRPQNTDYYFKEAVTWSDVNSGRFSLRYREPGSIHDVKGMSAFSEDHDKLLYLLGLLNTKIGNYVFKMINPTISLQIGNFVVFPVLNSSREITSKVSNNILMEKQDWNNHEEAWGFNSNPLIGLSTTLQESYEQLVSDLNDKRRQVKSNETDLNRFFIKLYGLSNELDESVEDTSLSMENPQDDNYRELTVKRLLSYFIGCVFGRYSLDKPGLAYAGGKWNESVYTSFKPNQDNLILLTDRDYFGDDRDIINRLREFLRITFDPSSLKDNLHFIAKTLDPKKSERGESDEQIIRNYFINDFYKDHDRTYHKRPIYWQFNSGRNDGFKALMYLHRYNKDELAMARNYLHDLQAAYSNTIKFNDEQENKSSTAREKNQYRKDTVKLNKKVTEVIKYDEALQHQALAQVSIDLDAGVVVNHAKVQGNEELFSKL
ncbi:BREX-1 system adenine-specific DNA-methyltransferase PglX [Lactiplantibacillus plantarum]|uniref:BREX-1 system adenine-specific DNA-methyltransferase PglX n=1 Tax=Lactiplantibacillus plantarum TaxID=1590 RepID=UPI00325B653C